MPALDDAEKPVLLDDQQSLKNAQATWAGALAALTSGGAAMHAPVVVVPSTVIGVILVVLKRQQNAVDRALADPPRADFMTQTRSRMRRYTPGRLGDDHLALATDRAAIAMLRVAAHLEAMVRADERAQGATVAGHDAVADERLFEAMSQWRSTRDFAALAVARLEALSAVWAEFATRPSTRDVLAGRAVRIGLVDKPVRPSSELRQQVELTGLVIEDLDLTFDPTITNRVERPWSDPVLDPIWGTREVARSSLALAGGTRLQRAAAAEDPVAVETYEQGRAAAERGELKLAQRFLQRAIERGSVTAALEAGMVALQSGDMSGAHELFATASEFSRLEEARMVQLFPLGHVELDDPISGYLPPAAPRLPRRDDDGD